MDGCTGGLKGGDGDGEFNGLMEELSAISPSCQEPDDGRARPIRAHAMVAAVST
jgi:hypothetical protein